MNSVIRSIRARLARLLLAVLNSRWLNETPCEYGFIGNVDAFSMETLRGAVRMRPDLTVAQLIREVEAFKACCLHNNSGLKDLEIAGRR